ncbi:hypothetical protein [Pantoea septica]|uniref:hypothetical protein n=1 Tax=Pantoea septica TaxID=472695 RepID=UPI0028A1F04B|nr:hypothetical protein [Pantoea septica]
MGARSKTYDERNIELACYDRCPERYGRLRLLQQGPATCLAKKKQEFYCLDCDAGREGGWWMLIHNVHYGKGCPVCASVNQLIDAAAAKWPDYRLVMLPTTKNAPQLEDIRYQMVPSDNPLPDSVGWSFTPLIRATIVQGLGRKKHPGREQDVSYNIVVKVYREWTDVFGSEASIRYVGKEKPGLKSPGPFFTVNAARCMRSPIAESYMAATGALAICKQERKDRRQDESLRLEAQRFGATIIGYEHSTKTGVRIRYKNRFGLDRLDSRERARETNWGQTKMRKGESLCAIILDLLFPSNDWRSNSRPLFLTYNAAGKEPSRLELDGYSDALKLAFEYQGDHHYHSRDDDTGAKLTLADIQKRDAFKVKVCADCQITLLVIPEMELDPQAFLEHILEICARHGRIPTDLSLSVDAIWEKWNVWCENPLAKFQNKVMEKLNAHQLISPVKEKIGKKTQVHYKCSNCGNEHKTTGKTLNEGPLRQGCPGCKNKLAGRKRRHDSLDAWGDSLGMPADFIANIKANSNSAGIRYVCEQDANHVIVVHDLTFAWHHIIDGAFICPECEAKKLGVKASSVAQQRQGNNALRDNLNKLGLSVIKFKPPKDGQATALVRCDKGMHEFEVTRSEASAMVNNKCLNDRKIVPSACQACCYPDEEVVSTIKRATIFHRLYVLRGMYPRASYIEGFDSKGQGEEIYACGNTHADGTPHSPVRISYRNMQKAARRSPATHLCVACGLEKGQVVKSGKNLDDLVALMHVMRDEIARHAQLPDGLRPPTVQFLHEPISDKEEISTTKTYLKFCCGVPGHAALEATKDYYFNRAKGRGAGFCPECVKLSGKKKAPIPEPVKEDSELRLCVMRND